MASVYERLLQRQFMKDKPEQEAPTFHGKRAACDGAPRLKLKLQRHMSEVSENSLPGAAKSPQSNGDETPRACEVVQDKSKCSSWKAGNDDDQVRASPPSIPWSDSETLGNALVVRRRLTPDKTQSEADRRMMELLFSDDDASGPVLPALPMAESGDQNTGNIPLPISMPIESKVSITIRANFDLKQQCAAAGCDLVGKTPVQALQAMLHLSETLIPPADAALLGLHLDGHVSTRANLEDTLSAARACVADMKSGDVHIRIDKRKRSDNNHNVHFGCKVGGAQVGSCILKPHKIEPAVFHQGAAIRIALAWRCIPLLGKHNAVDLETIAAVGTDMAILVNAWIKDDGWLTILDGDE